MHATKLWFKTCLNVGINNNFFLKNPKLRCFIIIITRKTFLQNSTLILMIFKKNVIERKPNNIKSWDTQSTLNHTILHILMLFVLIQTRKRRNDCSYSTQNISMEIVNILTFYIIIWKSGNDNFMLCLQTVITCPRIQDTVKSQIGLIFIHIFTSIRNFRQA